MPPFEFDQPDTSPMLDKLRAKIRPKLVANPKDEAIRFLDDLAAGVVEPQYQKTVEGIRDWFIDHDYLTEKQMAPITINARKQCKTIPAFLIEATTHPKGASAADESDMIQIDKGIPLPMRQTKYPVNSMEIGDSFFVPHLRTTDLSSILSYQKQYGKKFMTRTMVEDGVTGVRCWRIV